MVKCKDCDFVGDTFTGDAYICFYKEVNPYNGRVVSKGNIEMNDEGVCPKYKKRSWYLGRRGGGGA